MRGSYRGYRKNRLQAIKESETHHRHALNCQRTSAKRLAQIRDVKGHSVKTHETAKVDAARSKTWPCPLELKHDVLRLFDIKRLAGAVVIVAPASTTNVVRIRTPAIEQLRVAHHMAYAVAPGSRRCAEEPKEIEDNILWQ